MIERWTTFDDAYYGLYRTIADEGQVFTPRGLTCHELRPFSFTISDPARALYTGVSRRLSYRFFAIEALGYLAGLGGPGDEWFARLLVDANKGMASFLNPDTGLFDGAYGPRLAASYESIEELLTRDPDSRQAVMSIWDVGPFLGGAPTKDTPCTVMLQFIAEARPDPTWGDHVRRLSMVAYMRSNDVNWGTPYDVAAFCSIQLAMAAAVGLPVGSYTHVAGSFHYYEPVEGGPKPPIIASMEDEVFQPTMRVPDPRSEDVGRVPMRQVRRVARAILVNIHNQRERGVAWKDLTSTYETGAQPERAYTRAWMDLVRWRRWDGA